MQFQHAVMLDDLGAVLLGGASVGVDGTRGVDVAFAVGPHATQNAIGGHDRAQLSGFLRGDEATILDADRLEGAVGGLQPLPAVWGAGQCQTAGHVHAHGLAGFLLDLGEQVDGIGLQLGDVGISIERMKPACRVPARACRQHAALDQAHVLPAELGEVIEHGSADDAAANHDGTIVRFHASSLLRLLRHLRHSRGPPAPKLRAPPFIFNTACPSRNRHRCDLGTGALGRILG